MKNLIALFSIMFLMFFGLESLGCNTEISGPTTMCPGSEKFYTSSTTYNGREWTWSCSNCEVQDPDGGVWKTSYTHYAYLSNSAGLSSKDKTNVRFSTSGSSATIYYSNTDNWGTGTDSHIVYLTAPSSSPGSITGLSYLQNCNSTQNIYTLNPANSWVYNSWSKSSGLNTISSSSSNIKVQATSTTATGTQYVKAKMKWKDATGATCGTKYITRNITLTGSPSSNNIAIFVEGIGASNNAICSSGNSIISAFYSDRAMDSWEWDLPPSWTTKVRGSLVFITSAGIGGQNIRVRGRNECGWTGWKTQYIPVEYCSGEGPLFLSPNPAIGEVTLEEIPSGVGATQTKNENDYEVKFYDNTEMKTRHSKVKVGDKINTSRLANGTYIVHIIAPDESIVKTRLIVDR